MTKQQMKVVAQAEHEMFCLRDLLEGSVPAKVMNRAYEYVIKMCIRDRRWGVRMIRRRSINCLWSECH